jgi:hypothetical protein
MDDMGTREKNVSRMSKMIAKVPKNTSLFAVLFQDVVPRAIETKSQTRSINSQR